MQRFLLLTSAGLSVSLFIGLAFAQWFVPAKKGQKARPRAQRYLALVLLQAAAYFLKDISEQQFGWVGTATFLIYADFLFGIPALFLFLKATFNEPDPRPVRHFLPTLINLAPALAMGLERVGSLGIDGAVRGYLRSVPWLYINFLAACDSAQLVAYSRSGIKLLKRHADEPNAEAYRVVAGITICGYAGYYGVRWVGLAVRVALSPPGVLRPAPGWIGPISTYVLYFFVTIGGLYILTHSPKFFGSRQEGKPQAEGKKYGGKSLDLDEAETLVRRVKSLLASSGDLRDSNVNPRRLAQKLGVPYYLLSRIVNERCGMSVGALIRDARIAKATTLLEADDDARILDIALDSGFSAKSSFNTAFKEVVGISPTEYRRRSTAKRHGR